jgi:hypothetical protein
LWPKKNRETVAALRTDEPVLLVAGSNVVVDDDGFPARTRPPRASLPAASAEPRRTVQFATADEHAGSLAGVAVHVNIDVDVRSRP